jgi:predicted CXXCH cytochrome family protein
MNIRVVPTMKRIMKFRMWICFLAFSLLPLGFGVVFAQKKPASAKSSFALWSSPAKGDLSGYIGNKGCLEGECHTSRVAQTSKTVHIHTNVAGMSMNASCETCHGPGKEHTDRELDAKHKDTKDPEAAKLIFKFDGSPQENSAPCLACHSVSQKHDLFSRSEHKLQGVACIECHEPHLVEPGKQAEPSLAQARFAALPKLAEETRWLNESLLAKTQVELCVMCHRSIEAQFALPVRHRVLEGWMKCTDCHDAHGSLTAPLLQRATAYETCISCHTDKRGPFLHEHASVKVEGCTICHTPHGSIFQHLIQRGEDRFLCLSCHVEIANVNTPHGHFGYQTSGPCVRCHTAIHGSNFSPYLLQ